MQPFPPHAAVAVDSILPSDVAECSSVCQLEHRPLAALSRISVGICRFSWWRSSTPNTICSGHRVVLTSMRRRVWLHFGGVNNAFYCWLNGAMLGYSQDSCCPAEFDVTVLLKPGRNMLAVQVCPHRYTCIYVHTQTYLHVHVHAFV